MYTFCVENRQKKSEIKQYEKLKQSCQTENQEHQKMDQCPKESGVCNGLLTTKKSAYLISLTHYVERFLEGH